MEQLPSKDRFLETSVVVAGGGVSLPDPRRVFYRQLLAGTFRSVLHQINKSYIFRYKKLRQKKKEG